MKTNATLLTLLGLFSLLPARLCAQSGWTEYATIAELTPTIHHRYLVKLNLSENPSGCKSKGSFYQDYATTGAEQMFHTLLEAIASSKRVRVFVTGNCELNGYAEMSSVSIVP